MRTDVHLHALRAAAHVALAVPLLQACNARHAGPSATEPTASPSVGATEPAPHATPPREPEPSTQPSAEAPQAAAPLRCEETLAAAFPVESEYPGERQVIAPAVEVCCMERLKSTLGAMEHRWDCCASLPAQSMGDEIRGACTPWGPSVPPALAHRRDAASDRGARTILDLRVAARAHAPELPTCADDRLRRVAIATWRGRMINEHASARVFESLATQIAGAGRPDLLDASLVATMRGFAAEERTHGILCGAVVEALGGEARGHVPPAEPVPSHDDAATRVEAVLRNLLDVCCLSETVAVALIGAERMEMPDGPLRRLLTRIWADEVGHARTGWRVLARIAPRLDARTLERLGDYLEVAFAHLVAHELDHLPVARHAFASGASLGVCDGADARALFFDTVSRVIVPALEAHGIPAARAWSAASRASAPWVHARTA